MIPVIKYLKFSNAEQGLNCVTAAPRTETEVVKEVIILTRYEEVIYKEVVSNN